MKDLYNKNDYCMDFTNEEIEKYLINRIKHKTDIVVHYSFEDEEDRNPENKKIKCIYFDGNKGNFDISFYQHQTSIFITDETPMPNRTFTFNEEFMFIDDIAKEHMVSSDTYGNIVYEGTLRDKTHEEILGLFSDFIVLLIGAKKITFEETKFEQVGWQYPKCNYIVKVTNDTAITSKMRFNNILFVINE